ncbi:MAG: putative collagen-binding domain-containing protein [Pirellulaceae bacterium]
MGADAPETLLAYEDFDGTVARKPNLAPLKTWQPHVRDWQSGDPVWQGHKGKGLIGAVNYLADKGCNAFSFLTYNAGGDGDNVWPFVQREDKLHYDCSKLDQWSIVFDHATRRGMYLHFKMQETENDDQRNGRSASVPEALDGGALGIERKLYCRELVARFSHNLALNWNLGEENTQSFEEQQAMLEYLKRLDPYGHHRVIHTFPDQQKKVYEPHLSSPLLTGLSLQNSHISQTHRQTVHWVQVSAKTNQPWVVAFDESGSAAHGQCPDLGYQDFDGHDKQGKGVYTQHQVRQQTLWGTLMGGGAGVEYYFGYQFVQNDLNCQDWRSRDQSWDYCRIAIRFFHDNDIRFWEMQPRDELVGNSQHENTAYCLAKANESYVVYLANNRDAATLDLTAANGEFEVTWFDPENGGHVTAGTVRRVTGGDAVKLGQPRSERVGDWIILIRRRSEP